MDFGGLMRQAQTMQRQMDKARKEVEAKEFVINSNGGAIVVSIMGSKKINKIEIDEDLLNAESKEILEDMVAVAVNEAIKKADDEMNKAISAVTGGMSVPGMF